MGKQIKIATNTRTNMKTHIEIYTQWQTGTSSRLLDVDTVHTKSTNI